MLLPERGTEEFDKFWATPVSYPSLVADNNETRMLLACLLMFPDAGVDFAEDLAVWKAPSRELEECLAFVLDAINSDPDVSAGGLREYLTQSGRDGLYAALGPELEMLHRKKVLPTEAKKEFQALISAMNKKALRAELIRLASEIARADGEEASVLWERYQNLLKEEKDAG